MNLRGGLEALVVALIVFGCGRGLRRFLLWRGMKEKQVRWIVAPLVMIALFSYFAFRVWKIF